jgi:beta-fructofuranosidase
VKHPAWANATRRHFLSSIAAVAALTSAPHCLLAEAPVEEAAGMEAKLAADPERPQFHLLPAKNWMNDPNGPIYFKGRYHMFFQYDPHAAVWGDISWDHAISTDMIHWEHLPVAMTPTPGGPDAAGCFSGSCIAMGDRVYAVYTGVVESTPEKATIRDGSNKLEESQCLAYSDDPKLMQWTKLPKPIVPTPPTGLQITGFRDPSAWKQGDWYYMTVGSGIAKLGGCVLLYRSKDLKEWTYLHKLEQGVWNEKSEANPVGSGEMWECPEFFALDSGHVLIYSSEGKVFWQSGKLDADAMKFYPSKSGELDLGSYYAPKTQLDAHGQRILWGWIPETRPVAEYNTAGWSGMMSLPRVLRLGPDGVLQMQLLPALTKLRASSLATASAGKTTTLTLPLANGELVCTADQSQGFSLSLTNAGSREELMRITYHSENNSLSAEGKEVPMLPGETPRLHAFVDGSVIGIILNERIGYTKRFYYPGATAPDISVTLTGTGVHASAWKIKPISNNRLTTPALTM